MPTNSDLFGSFSDRGFLRGVAMQDQAVRVLGLPVILGCGALETVTGTLAKTELVSVMVPGGLLGANGRLRITANWTYTNSANAKTISAEFGGVQIATAAPTTTNTGRHRYEVWNAGAENVNRHMSNTASQAAIDFTAGSISYVARTIDTRADMVLQLFGQLAVDTELIRLEGWMVEAIPWD